MFKAKLLSNSPSQLLITKGRFLKMFTGLIEAQAKILKIENNVEVTSIEIQRPEFFDDLQKGHSVAVNGVCLTVTNSDPSHSDFIRFDLGAETLAVSALDQLKESQFLNLERAMKLGERLHGHIVTGHVDAVGVVKKAEFIDKGCMLISVKLGNRSNYIWSKGSIVLNGVSLTINQVHDNAFEVCLVPETIEKTNLKELNSGDTINIEYDFMAKGVIRASEIMSQNIELGSK